VDLLVPLMDTILIPESKPRLDLLLALGLLRHLHVLEEETELLAELVQALPPVGAAVLVAIPHEQLIEKLVDVDEHRFLVLRRVEEGCCGDCGRLDRRGINRPGEGHSSHCGELV
jgi:hypothetical protein